MGHPATATRGVGSEGKGVRFCNSPKKGVRLKRGGVSRGKGKEMEANPSEGGVSRIIR